MPPPTPVPPPNMFTVSREIEFCYGHRLLRDEGKCRHLHGHNGRLTVVFETTDSTAAGWCWTSATSSAGRAA